MQNHSSSHYVITSQACKIIQVVTHRVCKELVGGLVCHQHGGLAVNRDECLVGVSRRGCAEGHEEKERMREKEKKFITVSVLFNELVDHAEK